MTSGQANDDFWGAPPPPHLVGSWAVPPRPLAVNMGWNTATHWTSLGSFRMPTDLSDINPVPPNTPTENDTRYTGPMDEATSPEKITPRQLRKLLEGESVTIYVGPDREAFKLSKDLLCYVSPFFRAAFEGDFKESNEQTMELLEDDVAAFEHVVSYMYRGIFGSDNVHQNQIASCRPSAKIFTVISLLELAERLQIPDMKLAALTDLEWALHSGHSIELTAEDVELAFNLLPSDSQAITSLVEFVADDFLINGENLGGEGFGNWKFARLMDDVGGFDVTFALSLRRLAVGRLRKAHENEEFNCPNRPIWHRAGPHNLTLCPFASWRLPPCSWR